MPRSIGWKETRIPCPRRSCRLHSSGSSRGSRGKVRSPQNPCAASPHETGSVEGGASMSSLTSARNTAGLILVICSACLAQASQLPGIWTVLAIDPKGDGRDPSLADAAQLSYCYDKQQDMLWFRIALYGKLNEKAFGVNIVVDTGADESSKMNWWGANKGFKFDKLVTAWVTQTDTGYQGTIGIGDTAGVKAKRFNNLHQNNLQIRVEADAIVLGVKRAEIT